MSPTIFEPQNRIEVITPRGDGAIWLVTDYGHETDTIYTIILSESGEMWQFTHKDIRVKSNITFSRLPKNSLDLSKNQVKW